jgi:DNA-binding CsgD family transcriptional regulator
MKHLLFLYFFSALSIGLVSYGLLALAYIKSKERQIIDFGYFYTSFTLIVVSYIFLYYFDSSRAGDAVFFRYVDFFESRVAQYFLMHALPVFAHSLSQAGNRRSKNRWIGISALLLFILNMALDLYVKNELYSDIMSIVKHGILVGIMVYTIVIFKKRATGLAPGKEKTALKRFYGISLGFLPGVIFDSFFNMVSPFRFFPILYSGFGLLAACYFSSQLFEKSEAVVEDKSKRDSDSRHAIEMFIKTHGFSAREIEIVDLIVKGKSNQEIADTLFISLNTVKTHIRNIYQKAEVKRRFEFISLYNSTD